MAEPSPPAGPGLRRRLGLLAVTLSGVGVILGAGIYVLIGVAAGEAGNAVWLSFLIAAVAATLTGVSYARLGRPRPRAAPEFQYVGLAFGRPMAFMAGWMMLVATTISAATVSLGFASYLQHWLGVPLLAGAIGLVLFTSLVVFLGIGESAILAGTLTLIEAGGLLFIIVIGVPHIGEVDVLEMPLGLPGVFSAASLVFFAYLGFEGMANLTEEARDPERDMPRAILIALGISTAFYVLVSLSAVSVLGWGDLSGSNAPLAAVAARVLGPRGDLLLTLVALCSTMNTALIMLLGASRAMWAMSCAGALPMALCVIGEKRRTPWIAVIAVALFASMFASIRNIGQVADFTNFATLLAFVAVNASAMKLFGSAPMGNRLKHLLVNRALPVVGVVVSLALAANTGWKAAAFGGLLVGAGVLFYLAMGLYSRRKAG